MSRAGFASAYLSAYLNLVVFGLVPPLHAQEIASSTGRQTDAPSQAEQDRMLAAMRNYADEYTEKLPNFICQQTTSQYEAGRKPARWRKGDTLTSKLVFNAGREERKLEAVNNKPIALNTRAYRAPLTTAGEFGMWLSNIFNPATETKFSWAGWEELRGKRMAKFDYAVSQEHSTLSLTLSDLAKAVVAYHGSVYANPETGNVFRVITQTSDIPANIRTRSTATTIDYDAVKIGSQNYVLPVSAEVLMVTDNNHIRNVMEFGAYRKFEAESTITFGTESEAPKSTPEPPL